MSMSFEQNSACGKSSLEEYSSTKSNFWSILAENKRIKPIYRAKVKTSKRNIDKEFKAQITPHGSALQHSLALLQNRLSNNYKKLLSVWQSKSIVLPPIERSNLEEDEVNKNHSELVDDSASSSFPSITKPRKLKSPKIRFQTVQVKENSTDDAPVVSVGARTTLIPRYEIVKRDSTCQNIVEKDSKSAAVEERISTCKPVPLRLCRSRSVKTLKAEDCFGKTDSSDCEAKSRHVTVPLSSNKPLHYKDLSPIVFSGTVKSPLASRLGSPPVVNLRIDSVKFLHFNKYQRPSWKKCIHSSRYPELDSLLSFASSPNYPDSEPSSGDYQNQNYYFSQSRYTCRPWIWNELMKSSSHSINHNKIAASQSADAPLRVAEHRSFVHLPSSFKVPVGTVGHMSIPEKTTRLRNSKSFHGDSRDVRSHATRGQQSANPSSLSNGSSSILRQQQQARKLLERQRMKVLKPLSVAKNHNQLNKFGESGQEFSAAILPHSGTASYRINSDVSFDEGSRYNGGGNTKLKSNNEEHRNSTNVGRRRIIYTTGSEETSAALQNHGRIDKLGDSPNRDRYTPSGQLILTYHKESPSVRLDERDNTATLQYRHPSPNFLSSSTAGSRGHSSPGGNASSNGILSANGFRSHKDPRTPWNHRMGDLSVNGGGFYGSAPIQPGGRVDIANLGSLSISPASSYPQKMSQPREKNGGFSKSRMPSRYTSRFDAPQSYTASANKECSYADPVIGASSSFQQRLNELSMLESDTIKYERTRRIKRKTKQEKDS